MIFFAQQLCFHTIKLVIATLTLLSLSISIQAQDNLNNTKKLEFYQKKAYIKNLSKHKTWQRLLYYPKKAKQNSIFISRIDPHKNSTFFLHSQGHYNYSAEFDSMLTELFNFSETTNQSVQCRFPARTHWIKQMLDIPDNDLPKANCNIFNDWFNHLNPKTASIIFAEEYLQNPASAFAHSFLRLDNGSDNHAVILNYTPKTTAEEPFIKFAYKTIIKGNDGEFTLNAYQTKIDDYKNIEGRDIWQYQLNLSTEEVQQLARQIWEIKDQTLTYSLLTDNCASEILVLLNNLRPHENYLKDFKQIIAPAEIIRKLHQHHLIKNINYEPSKPSIQSAKISQQNLINSKNRLNNNPISAHSLSRNSLSVGQQNDNYFTEVGYRLVYHDMLDKPLGYPVGFSLEGLSTKVRIYSSDYPYQPINLQELTLIKARSLQPINTIKKGTSWGGNIGLQQVYDGLSKNTDSQHLIANLSGEYGFSVAYGKINPTFGNIPINICYALATGAMQIGKGLTKGYQLGIGTNIGCLQHFHPNFRGMLEVSLPYWIAGDSKDEHYWQPKATVALHYDISKNQALRTNASYVWQPNSFKKNQQEFSIQYLQYF